MTKEIEVKSGEYNISIPLTHRNENENLCFDYHIVGLELKIITKNVENEYSIFPILGNSTGYGMEICMGNTDSISMATHAIEITKIAKPIYSGFIKNGNEGFRDYQSYAFMPRKLRTSKSIFRLTPKTDFICDTKGLFFTSASLCQMKALLDTNGGLYHYTEEDKNECHSLTHPDFGVDKIENSSLVINVSHEKINDF